MRKYETIVVLDPSLGEAQVKEEMKKIETMMKAAGADGIATNLWGKREIAYHVGKNKFGFYVVFNFTMAEPMSLKNITNSLRITDQVIKFQTHVVNERKRKFKGNPKKAGQLDDEFAEADF